MPATRLARSILQNAGVRRAVTAEPCMWCGEPDHRACRAHRESCDARRERERETHETYAVPSAGCRYASCVDGLKAIAAAAQDEENARTRWGAF